MSRHTLIPLLLLALWTSPSLAADDWGPWDLREDAAAQKVRRAEQTGFNPLKAGVRFFQKFISPVDGPRCPMYPTCSAYALEALDKHGPFIGTMMTVDRLLHETDPREHRHPIKVGGRKRFYDPVKNNDFWLAGGGQLALPE